MDGMKRRWNEFNGTRFLLLFALGAVESKVCGDNSFSKKIKKFFKGEYPINKMKEEIPLQLDTAWPVLLKISQEINSTPLSFNTVSTYVFNYHNLFTEPECQVKTGFVKKINKKTMIIERYKKEVEINFLPLYHDHRAIKAGERVNFHYNWLIGKA